MAGRNWIIRGTVYEPGPAGSILETSVLQAGAPGEKGKSRLVSTVLYSRGSCQGGGIMSPNDAAGRPAESEQEIREKVLAELSKWVNENSWRNDAESVACVYSYALVQKIAELRKQGDER